VYIEVLNAAAELRIAQDRAKIEAARKAGLPEPELTPHPDDIIIEPGKRFQIVGPATPEALEYYKRYFANREVLLMQHIVEEREGNATVAKGILQVISYLDALVPERMRLDDMAIMMSPYRRVPNRKLRALIRKSWLDLGAPTW
jgi:hypothetical protein